MIIADRCSFYKGLNRKDKTLNKTDKLKTKLAGGFFIQCSDEEYAQIQNYWGGNIVQDIY